MQQMEICQFFIENVRKKYKQIMILNDYAPLKEK